MITNSNITVYHQDGLDANHLEKWTRYNYSNVWFFNNQGASINKGYEQANLVQIRIPYNSNLNIGNFAIGDIVVKGTLDFDITKQQDLSSYQIYNITSINDNNFGNNPHIHIGGR